MDRRKTDRRADGNRDLYIFNVEDLLNILWRRRAFIALFMLAIIIPGALYVLAKPKTYVATSTAILEDQDYALTDFETGSSAPPRLDDMSLETQFNILKSPSLVRQTLTEVNKLEGKDKIDSTSLDRFYRNFSATPVGKSRMVAVTYKSSDPVLAAEVVNAHMQNYIDYRMDTKKSQITAINEWLDEQVEALKQDSQTKSQAMQDFRNDAGIVMGANSQELIYQQISDLTEQLVPIETQKMSLQAKANAMAEASSKNALPEILESQTISSLKSEVTAAQQEVKALRGKYGKSHPDLVAAEKRLSQVSSDLYREIANVRTSIKVELEAATKQEQLLRQRIEELNAQADRVRDKSVTLESLEGELDANRKLLTSYTERFEELKSKVNLSSSDVRVVSKADVPTDTTGTRRIVLIALIGMFSVVFAVGAALLLELIDHGIEQEDDVKNVLNLKLLGILPKVGNPLDEASKGRTNYNEELKRIYLALAAKKVPQSILFTAAKSGEGKSTIALSLAQYLSSIRSKVVIVDANTSSPNLSTLAGTNASPGFAELMAGAVDADKAVQRDDKGMAVIAAGDQDNYPTDLLASDAFAKMIEILKVQYDYVIVDCEPVLNTTDAEVISGQVDQVVVVVEWAKTSKKHLKQVASTLRQYAKETPNVILNKRA